MTPVVVTGSRGYLGGRVMNLLAKKRIHAIGVSRTEQDCKCDLCDLDEVLSTMNKLRPKRVIHCGAVVPLTDGDYRNEHAGQLNLSMVKNLLQANIGHIVFASSMTVYDAKHQKAVKEEDAAHHLVGYSASKRQAEKLLEASQKRSTVLRFPGLFGPPRKSGLLFNVAQAFFKGECPTLPDRPPLWGGLHVDDAADLCIRAAFRDRGDDFIILNAGYPDRQAIHCAVAELARRFHVAVPDMNEGPIFQMNLDHLEETLGLPLGTWPDRLDELVAWVSAC